MKSCSAPDCDYSGPVVMGMCRFHYKRHANGTPFDQPRQWQTGDYEERLWSRITGTDDPLGCWLWTAGKSRAGYGQIHVHGRTEYAHRLTYTLMVADIPPGLDLDHLCVTPACVNPWHLEPVTHSENMRRIYRRRRAA